MRFRTILLASALALGSQTAFAQSVDTPVVVDLPAQRLDESLMQISRNAAVQLAFFDDAIARVSAPRLSGRMTLRAALDRLLDGSGYGYEVTDERSVRIVRLREDAAAVTGQIIVTGSRIARSSLEAPTPVIGISSEELEESGATEISEMIAELPSASSTLNDSTVAGNIQNSGLSAIQLRNLGDNRTLVLIDGRRTVSNSANANRVSTSTIPSIFIDRIEILTGGTSSIYGSDAVAGVVNIITTDKRGLSLNARGGMTEEGDGEELTLEGRYGTRFGGGRGYFAIAGTYDRDYGIRASDREWASRQVSYGYDDELGVNLFETLYTNSNNVLTSGDQPADSFPPNIFRDLSSYIPGGVFYAANSAQDRFYDENGLVPLGPNSQTGGVVTPGTRDDGNSGYFLPNRDGYNQRAHRSLILPRERYMAAAKFSYEVSDATSIFGQVQFSRVKTRERREPVGLGFDSTVAVFDPVTGTQRDETIGRIPCRREGRGPCNPFVPYDVFANNFTNSTTGIAWDRRFNEVGFRDTTNTRDTVRSWVGARGKAWGDWTWETSAGYGRYDQEQTRTNEINGLALREALNAQIGPDGSIECANPDARAAGCVPVNLFGEGAITPEMADYIRADLRQSVTIEQQSFQGFMSGSVFDLPAGPVRGAYGIEYRKDSQTLRGDELSNRGGTTGNMVPDFDGSISAMEGFAEISVPLLRARPFFEMLSVDASARVAHYDIANVGTVFSYRAGLQWAPIRDIRVRTQFARAQRAPDIAELFSPPRGDFDTVVDVCNRVTPSSSGRIAERCRADVGIQTALTEAAANGEPVIFQQSGSSIYSPNGGNLNLKEETADTFSVGVVATPRFLPGLTVAVDYYDIDIRDAISQHSNESILLQCYDSDINPAENPFCADIARNPNTGQITSLVQRQFNISNLETSGLDVAVQYRFDLEPLIGIPGRWDLRYDGTHVFKQESRFEGLEGTVITNQRGDLSQGSFKYRARGSLSWRLDGFRLRYTVNYLSPTIDSRIRLNQYLALAEDNADAQYPLFLKIPAVWEHDVYAAYSFKMGGGEARIYGGVKNLFNDISPFLPTGDVVSGRLTNYNGAYDVAGRRFYLGLRVDF